MALWLGTLAGRCPFLSCCVSDRGWRQDQLWSKPVVGGQWCCCLSGKQAPVHTESTATSAESRYLFFFQDGHGGICAGPDTVLMYDLQKNKWSPPTSARATRSGHQEEVHWQPLSAAQSGEPLKAALIKAWILEASMDYVAWAPKCRTGLRNPQKCRDMKSVRSEGHTALYFISCTGQELVHHLPCDMSRMTVQRYNDYVLFVKDFGDEELDLPDYPPECPCTAAWLLVADDWTAGPMAARAPSCWEPHVGLSGHCMNPCNSPHLEPSQVEACLQAFGVRRS
ncbi:unnamed protein product [Symbiodinium natans]|uniref:Uncharacterized protein n=1 Tax=Symbiodinium natans TaxID=878477 RepID=A0A812SRD7_9DINO|nr:unnamed protein product [Symbiodinium natans]